MAASQGSGMRLLVTGAAGFIGSTYVRLVKDEHDVVVLDKLTYAGRRENVPDDVELVVGAIEDRDLVLQLADDADAIVNFAAESHVDRSIADQDAFARTHVIGTSVLLDAVRERGVARYLQVSTDEVYGSIEDGAFTERSPLSPSSPYSATKAGGDLLVSAYAHTHGIESVICRGSNNYGPRQYPEKLIPLCILNAMHGDPLPVYGDGRQVRNWLYVEDFCRGIHAVLERGRAGEAYNVGGPDESENIEVVRRVLELTGGDDSLIEFVKDRPGHDRRYSLASDKIRAELGWEPQVRFADGIARTVDWYRDNEDWWAPIRSGEYRDYYESQYGRTLVADRRYLAGAMLSFTRKKLSGSYSALTSARRAMFRPRAESTPALGGLVRPPGEVQVDLTGPVLRDRAPGAADPRHVGLVLAPRRTTCRRSTPCSGLRVANAVSSSPTRAIAPPMWNVLTSVSGAGRSLAFAAIVSMAASLSSSRYWDFQYARSSPRGNNGSNPVWTPTNGVGPDMSNSTVPSSRSGAITRMPSSTSPA